MIPDAAVEAALLASRQPDNWMRLEDEALVRTLLEAAAPHIQAVALKAAAEAAEGMHDPVALDCREWADWLRARARIGVPTYTAVSE